MIMKTETSAISRLRDCMGSPIIDCRELSRLIDEIQNQESAENMKLEYKLQDNILRGGAR